MVRLIYYLSLGGLILTTGCGKPDKTPTARSRDGSATLAPTAVTAPKGGQQVFRVKGIVEEVKAAEKTVTIKHEEIPGYMQAMTMPFEVKNTNELAGLAAGD